MEVVNLTNVEKRAFKEGDWVIFSLSLTIFVLFTLGNAIHYTIHLIQGGLVINP